MAIVVAAYVLAIAGASVLVTIGANDFSERHDDVVEGRCTAGTSTDCVDEELSGLRRT